MKLETWMRVAFVTIEYPPRIIGGAGTYAFELTTRLARMGHEVTVFIPRRPDDEGIREERGVKACYIDINPLLPMTPQFWLKLPKAISSEGRFDVLHLNSFNFFFLGRKRLADCSQIMTLHHLAYDAYRTSGWGLRESLRDPGNENGFFMHHVERSCVRHADHLLAVSNYTRARAVEHYGLDGGRVSVIHNGVDPQRCPPSGAGAAFRKKYGLSPGPLLLFVGRVEDRRKGIDVLLKAMALLPDDVHLLIVGKGRRERLFDLARQAGVEGRIAFTGFISDEELPSAYAAADICVVPSRMEGFCLAAVHAMMAGLPVIASRAGALPEVVQDDEQLFNVGDHEDLAERTARLLSDPERMAAMGEKNRLAAGSFRGWDEVALMVEDAYRSAMSKKLPDVPGISEYGEERRRGPIGQ